MTDNQTINKTSVKDLQQQQFLFKPARKKARRSPINLTFYRQPLELGIF